MLRAAITQGVHRAGLPGEIGARIDRLTEIASSLADHVAHILGMRSEKEMVRPNTGWLIALVTYLDVIWNWAEMKYPRQAVAPNQLPTKATEADATVAVVRLGAYPQPTGVRLRNFLPEAFGQWALNRLGSALMRAILHGLLKIRIRELLLAVPAGEGVGRVSHACIVGLVNQFLQLKKEA